MNGKVHGYGGKMTLWERLYLGEIFRGLGITIRHVIRNLLHTGDLPTVQYPEERRAYSERFRGRHRLMKREDGTPRCVACMMCSTACPADCIHIVAGDAGSDEARKDKRAPKEASEKYRMPKRSLWSRTSSSPVESDPKTASGAHPSVRNRSAISTPRARQTRLSALSDGDTRKFSRRDRKPLLRLLRRVSSSSVRC